MALLIARGPHPHDNWQRTLPDHVVTLGRLAAHCDWDVPWDAKISKCHASVRWSDGRLIVQRLEGSRNPVFRDGQDQGWSAFPIGDGESFVIGETTFTLMVAVTGHEIPFIYQLPQSSSDWPPPAAELTISRQEMQQVHYRNGDHRINLLAALPELLRGVVSDAELEQHVVRVLVDGLPDARAAAVVVVLPPAVPNGSPTIQVRSEYQRPDVRDGFRPSRRLVHDAIERLRQSVLYRWDGRTADKADFTLCGSLDWALCVPLPDEPTPGWGLYVAGKRAIDLSTESSESAIKSDVKFAELVADLFGSLRQVRSLQNRYNRLKGLLSRPLVAVLDRDRVDLDEALKASETPVTVLFCDLRGSCRLAEESQHDLSGLWSRVSEALGVMTSKIVEQDGVIGDFQGDAAMGFWGWPLSLGLSENDLVERAARAALNIRRDFVRFAVQSGHALTGFACGVGIAHGPAIAGKLGASDQFKVGVFGPVVNRAARLESLTKRLGVSILLDEAAAEKLATRSHAHWCRIRRIARVRPAGMCSVVLLHELLPTEMEAGALPERDRRDYEAALEAFLTSRWSDAERKLKRLRAHDGPSQFLYEFMESRAFTPPSDWEGVIALPSK